MITRRTFLGASAFAASFANGCARTPHGARVRPLRYLGWQVGLTYQSMTPAGLDRDYLLRHLDEMAVNRMNLLSLMMQSYGYFDPAHDGYAWPVRNPRLLPYQDPNAVNARPGREFVRDIIEEAAGRRIEIQLFLNWGIWNPDFVNAAYPQACLQTREDGAPAGWLHCPDAPGAWQLGLDEAADLLTFYDHANVTGYAFERISYAGTSTCYCPYTRSAFHASTGTFFDSAGMAQREAWKTERISRYLAEFSAHLRNLRPGIAVGLHTQCARGWGHDPKRLASCGIDCVFPHTIQFPTTRPELYAMLDLLAPNPCILHFCTRDKRPENYKLWLKTPEIIDEVLGWIHDYPGDNVTGILFFNEPATSPANKQAVYRGIRRFT